MVRVQITETITYSQDVALSLLERHVGVTLDESGMKLQEFIGTVQDALSWDDPDHLAEYLERNGDVRGQVWTAEWADEEEGETDGH